MISQIELDITEMESLHEKIKKILNMANKLFPNNAKLNEFEEKISKIC